MIIGAAVIPYSVQTRRVLLGLRSAACDDPGTWAGFGGKRDRGDRSLAHTALRELAEETGYTRPIALVPGADVALPDVWAHVFVGLVPDEFEPALNWEHDMALWLEPKALDETKLYWGTRQFFESTSGRRLIAQLRRRPFR